MNSLNELNIDGNKSLPGFLQKHQLFRFLAFGVAACLMFWLSDGLIPQNWQLTLLACLQFPALLSTRGMEFLLAFLLLLGQSLLLLIAWGLYIMLVIREIRSVHPHIAARPNLMARHDKKVNAGETVIFPHSSSASNDSLESDPSSESFWEHLTREHSEVQPNVEFNPFESEVASVDTMISPLSHSAEKPVQASYAALYGKAEDVQYAPTTEAKKMPLSAASFRGEEEDVEYIPTVELKEVPSSASSMQERNRGSLKRTNLKRNAQQKEQPTVVEADKAVFSPPSLVERTSLISFNDIKGYEQQPMPGEITPAHASSPQLQDDGASSLNPTVSPLAPDTQEPAEGESANPFYMSDVGQEAPNFASILHDLGFFNLGQSSVEQDKVQQVSLPQPKVKLVPPLQNKPEEIWPQRNQKPPEVQEMKKQGSEQNKREIVTQQENQKSPEVREMKKQGSEQNKRGVVMQQGNQKPPEAREMKKLTSEVNPFEVHADIMELFAAPSDNSSNIREEEDLQPNLPLPAELPPDQLYVYGNPFEGPLPDVFQHDEELKKSVLGRVTEDMEGHGEKQTENTSQNMSGADRQRRAAKRNKNH